MPQTSSFNCSATTATATATVLLAATTPFQIPRLSPVCDIHAYMILTAHVSYNTAHLYCTHTVHMYIN